MTIRTAVSALLVAVVLLCGGCMFDFSSAESLIRAPKLTGEFAEVERVFEDAVGTDIRLLNPRYGEYRTAYVFNDYDGDGTDEAIVFYLSGQDELTARIHFLDCIDGNWISAADEQGKESEVSDVVFEDLNNDGVREIIVAYNSKRSNKTMSVYRIEAADEKNTFLVQSLSTVQFLQYSCVDMDQDSEKEIVYTVLETNPENGLNIPYVRVLKFVNDMNGPRIDMVASLPLDSGVTAFSSFAFDRVLDVTRLYIDCFYSDAATGITEILTWEAQNGYYLLLHKQDPAVLAKTARTTALLTEDIDSDAVMDIPSESELPGSAVVNNEDGTDAPLYVRKYYNCNQDGSLILKSSYITDPFGLYQLNLLAFGTDGSICVEADAQSGEVQVYSYDALQMKRTDKLFTVFPVFVGKQEADIRFDITQAGINKSVTVELLEDAIVFLNRK